MATQLLERTTIELIDQDASTEQRLFVKTDYCECVGDGGCERKCPFASVCGVLDTLTTGSQEVGWAG